MVTPSETGEGGDDFYDELQKSWPRERPSRKRRRREYRRKQDRRVVVSPKRLERPVTSRMSRALLAAQRELAQAQAEKEARIDQSSQEGGDG